MGTLRWWFLRIVYLPAVRRGEDVNKINVLLSHADFRETRLILAAMGAHLDPTAYVETHLLIHNAKPDYRNLIVGPGCYIGKDCFIDLSEQVRLEADVTIAMRVTLLTHLDAGHSHAARFYPRAKKSIAVCRGAYIGANATILPGVTIHEQALVMAGAVVTQDVPARTMVGGVPARVIKKVGNENQSSG